MELNSSARYCNFEERTSSEVSEGNEVRAEHEIGFGLNGVEGERGWTHFRNGTWRLRGWRMKRFGLGGGVERKEEVEGVVVVEKVVFTVTAMVTECVF